LRHTDGRKEHCRQLRNAGLVEHLLTGADEDGRVRELYLASVEAFNQWSEALNEQSTPRRPGEGFSLMILADATGVDNDAVGALADWCLENGLFSVSVWGPGCERVHDVFDEEDVIKGPSAATRGKAVVMSTWHESESLLEALEYFWTSTFEDESVDWGPAWIILVVGRNDWAEQARALAATELAAL